MEGGHRLPFAGPTGARGCQELIHHAEEQGQPSATLQAAGDQAKWDMVGFCPFAACVTPQWPPLCSGMSCLEPALSVCLSSLRGRGGRALGPAVLVAGCQRSSALVSQGQLWPRPEVMEPGRGEGREGQAGEGEGCRVGRRQTGQRGEVLWALLSGTEWLEGLSSKGTLLSPTGAPTLCWILLGSLRCCGWDLPG